MSTNNLFEKSISAADGTSRTNRLLEQLSTDYAMIDDRSFEDLLMFASKYASLLNYYNPENKIDGNWKAFFDNDISTFIVSISKTNCSIIKDKYYIVANNTTTKAHLKELFIAIITLAKIIDGWSRRSVKGLTLNTEIEIAIQSELKNELKKLIAYDKGYSIVETDETEPTPIGCNYSNLGASWIDESISSKWNDYIEAIAADKSIYSSSIDYKTVYKINQIFGAFYKALNSIISKTPSYLSDSLENWPYHKPHLGLFLSFLKLFKYAQDDINKIGEKHIDYYFRDILKFKENDIYPDTVNVYFELAKNIDTHLLTKGTLVFAGKDTDSNKRNILFGLDEDLIVNKAKIAAFKTLFFSEGNVYAAPIANSVDGNGKEYKEGILKWALFGEDQKGKEESNRTMSDSEIGFGVASPILFLKEGTRIVTFSFYFPDVDVDKLNGIQIDADNPCLKVFFSSDKSWVESSISSITEASDSLGKKFLKIELLVDSGLPAITSYKEEFLINNFETSDPVAKFIFYPNVELDNNSWGDRIISCFSNSKLLSLLINVNVEGMTNFIVQNDHTKLDPTKPFMPFTNLPSVGSNFYIGSEEIFRKKIDSLTLNINWLNSPLDLRMNGYYAAYKYVKDNGLDQIIVPTTRNNNEYQVQLEYLLNNKWVNSNPPVVKQLFDLSGDNQPSKAKMVEEIKNFKSRNDKTLYKNNKWAKDNNEETNANNDILPSKVMAFFELGGYERNPEIEDFFEYNNTVKAGFIRLKLTPCDFFHNLYSKVYTATVLAKNKTQSINLPNEPYTPQIESLKIDYSSTVKVDFSNAQSKNYEQFFHIYPFGSSEFVLSDKFELNNNQTYISEQLLPNFKIPNSNESIKGSLFIGVEELDPPQNLTLYFQLAEGSENPDIQKPEKLSLSYLSNNRWVAFTDDELISDSTEGLAKSGIIKLSVPETISNDNTLMPSGLFWLQAAVGSNTEAFNKVIGVYSQAVSATFINNSNDTSRLSNSLPAETVAKLLVKDTAIKSLTQPDSSFNGKAKEDSSILYSRASERLRHKNRLVTPWDYEHLILENFEEVYKVKCLKHTKVVSKDNIKSLYGQAPGNTTIIVIPELRNENTFNPLQPKFGNEKRLEILNFLKEYSSPFVKHFVENPFYETIKVVVEIEFMKGYDVSFYKAKLDDDLKKFICPWAYDDVDIVLGGKLHKSSILNYIEKLEYIDHILNIQMFKNYNSGIANQDIDLAIASNEGSVLVTDISHEII